LLKQFVVCNEGQSIYGKNWTMGDGAGKSAVDVELKADDSEPNDVLLTLPSSVNHSSAAGIVGAPIKVPNGAGQAVSVGDVVLPIDGEDSNASSVLVEGNGKTKKTDDRTSHNKWCCHFFS
jgi:hypothetical protein